MTEVSEKLLDEASSFTKDMYADIGHPVLKPIGEILSMFPRTLKVFLSGWDKWLINREESLQLTAKSIEAKLAKIEETKICEPEPFVAIPAIQQLCICQNSEELREMYANLLATSMNVDKKALVHPSFVEIIKQLNPDEAKYLRSLKPSKIYPLVDIRLKSPLHGGGYNDIRKNVTSQGYDIIESKEHIGAYLDNLNRLGIISIEEAHLIDDKLYESTINLIERTIFVPETTVDGWTRAYKKHTFELTELGKLFINVVVSE